jgi:hypothetical protein
MKQEVIQDFLNLPGIAGVALMDGRSRPYFCGVDQTLNFQQKEALAQGILQVVETIPEGFESFEFQFTGHQVYIYKLDHGIILLVLTRDDLVHADYLRTVKKLQAALQEDIVNAIATFRLIAGNITLSGLNYHKNNSAQTSASRSEPDVTTVSGKLAPNRPSNRWGVDTTKNDFSSGSAKRDNLPPELTPRVQSDLEPKLSPSPPENTVLPLPEPEDTVTLKELIAALNDLSRFTTQYLGTAVIVNYWKSTRPDVDWLSSFQIDRSAQISYLGSQKVTQPTSTQEQQWIKEWVKVFIKRCSQVIRDFPVIVDQKGLNERQKTLLMS